MAIAWDLQDKEVVFQKYSMKIERRNFKLPDGRIDEYYVWASRPGACVLAITKDKKVVTIQEYRPGPQQLLNELPGGFIDEGETAEIAGMRELLEETGYKGSVQYTSSWVEDAYLDKIRNVVVATDCEKVAEPELGENEFGTVALLDIEEFVARARAGKLTDTAGALMGLDYLGLLSSQV